ncbi:hypothetical protein NEOLEDRAFT_1073436 [Neolentinus lepideus HHB14362 ss-1]|uniref:Phospholipid/glycerol acyltransferase domain-containing protein n=1 Tax=Neolentinus lepideus HHB14362 ss-1 TaxID=1314782 RepID=A0A165PS84_9AGAM|nr:hypothetical protein NEOLEDRAFT_1073436 [Neolentinus lepideus HHB14362 ss-1]
MLEGTRTPWSYFLIRLLFKFALKIFYGTIVVENADYVPKTGEPCVVCANHSNSLTDALLLVTSVPQRRRNMLRLTAKSTQFGKKTFTSWLIESAGTVPIKRRKDFGGQAVDNVMVMGHLMDALELGDAVCFFPEGASRFHPTIAPLKTGVARLVSDVLSRNRHNPDFEISILNCSITYMHRQHWRSDVLVTFHPPMRFTPKNNPELLDPVEYGDIRMLTARMHQQISSGTLDSPSWDLVRTSKLAARMYAPLGTRMSLGDYVRVARTFLDAFKLTAVTANRDANGSTTASSSESEKTEMRVEIQELGKLRQDLKAYQDALSKWGVKDDRIRIPLSRSTILRRIFIRLSWTLFLGLISIPGLVLWCPIFITTYIAVRNFKKTGPIWDTWDEIAQYKLVYGLISGLCVYFGTILVTLPIAPITAVVVPMVMWMALRWMEDAVSAFRAVAALARLLLVRDRTLAEIGAVRKDLYERVTKLAERLGLPQDPERSFSESGGREKGRVRGRWESRAKYFSIRRRRKRDWNETLRLYDQVDYPEE